MRLANPLGLLAAAALTLTLAACGAQSPAPAESAGSASESASGTAPDPAPPEEEWPRSVEVAGQEVTIDAPAERIVAITSETADLALQIAGPDRVVAVPESSQAPNSGTAVELAREVQETLPSTTEPDPEQVLAFGPDLVLSTSRHGGEKAAGEQLQATGVPMLNFSTDYFNTPEGVADAITVLGVALGEEERAAEMSTALLDELETIDGERGDNAPTTLSLMARGESVMAMDDASMLPHLIQRAGGENAAGAIGITETRPIDAELIAAANPEVIFVEDFMGLGLAPFEEMLENPALAEVPAIVDDQVHLIPMTHASGVSGTQTAEGYREIVEIINGAA